MLQLKSPSRDQWKAFVEGKERSVAPESLIRSWERSLEAGVPATGEAVSFVDSSTLLDRRAEQDELRHHSLEVLDELAESLAESGYVAVLADTQGVILDRRGGGQFLDAAQQAQLVEGANWAEQARGTNAIGTALVENSEVEVHGRAHIHEANHGLVCYAMPIVSPRGKVTGVIDLTSDVNAAAPLALTALRAAARRVQERWSLDVNKHLCGLESVVKRCAEPVALVDLVGRIHTMNGAMQKQIAGRRVENLQPLVGMSIDVLARHSRRGTCHANGEGLLAENTPLTIDWIENQKGERSAALITIPLLGVGGRSEQPEEPVDAFAPLLGEDPQFRLGLERAEQLADTELPLVLLADTGTGKELLARGIHDASSRSGKPFVAVNCAGFTDSLLQSELFGYGDGAFTGATPGGRKGLIEAADGGTLFLDEIADLPQRAQASLLRFLESGTFNRVGETQTRRADVRLLSATCRDLKGAVDSGDFRKDLFYRIRGAELTLPALADRNDVVYLAERLLERMAIARGVVCPDFTLASKEALERHDWPGNVRELKQALEVAMAMRGRSIRIELEHLPPDLAESHQRSESALMRETRAVVDACGGNVSEAARRLGVARSTIYRRLDD